MQDRRSDIRMLCADMVEVAWHDSTGRKQRTTALLEDISATGACLQFESAVPLGVELCLALPKHHLVGYVRYCVYREIGYFIGVEFAATSRWSRRSYRPQHLLDLEKLLAAARKH